MASGDIVGTLFKTAAPIAIGAVGGPVAGAAASAATGLIGDSMTGPEPGAAIQSAMTEPAAPITGMSAGEQVGGTSTGLLSWMENNPETSKMIAGFAGGAAKGFAAGRRMDRLLEQRERERFWPGAFYGRTA